MRWNLYGVCIGKICIASFRNDQVPTAIFRSMLLLWQLFGLISFVPLGISQPADTPKLKLLIAFASFKDRPKQPTIHFYEHDGVGEGKIVGSIDTTNLRSDHHPVLTRDGRYCAFASELENQNSRIFLWDRSEKKLVTQPIINDS